MVIKAIYGGKARQGGRQAIPVRAGCIAASGRRLHRGIETFPQPGRREGPAAGDHSARLSIFRSIHQRNQLPRLAANDPLQQLSQWLSARHARAAGYVNRGLRAAVGGSKPDRRSGSRRRKAKQVLDSEWYRTYWTTMPRPHELTGLPRR